MYVEGRRRDIAEMSDSELRWEIERICTFGLLLGEETRERRRCLLLLLEKEAQRRGIRTDGVKDSDDCNGVARPRAKSVFTIDIEDEQMEDASRKYFPRQQKKSNVELEEDPGAAQPDVLLEDPELGMTFDTENDVHRYYNNYAKAKGFGVTRRSSNTDDNGELRYLTLCCSRYGKPQSNSRNMLKPNRTAGLGCKAKVNIVRGPEGKFHLSTVILDHNHTLSPHKSRLFRCNKKLDFHVKRSLELNDQTGIRVNKNFNSLVVTADGHGENNCYRAHRSCNLDPAMEKRSIAKGSGEPKGCSSCSLPKKARTARKATSKCNPEYEEEGEEELCNVFTHEMDTLECDICCLPFESQIYSCKNGHAVCARCCISMERKCPSCNESIDDFRCRAMEKILAGMTRPCRFKKHGCPETLRYTEARSHEEELCRYAPYRCPFDGCAYRGRLLYGHILDAHAIGATSGLSGPMTMTLKKCEPFRALLHGDGEGVFLLLNGGGVLTGRSLALVRVCPYPVVEEPEGVDAMYTIGVKGDEPGLSYLTASGKVQFVRQLEGYKAKGFLFVPDDFWGSSGSVTVTVYL